MLNFVESAGTVVAGDTKAAVASYDEALLGGIRMWSSIIEATQTSNLPAGDSQKLFGSLGASLQSVLQGRADLVSAIRQLTDIKGRSNFAPIDFGCPEPWKVAHQPALAEAFEASAQR